MRRSDRTRRDYMANLPDTAATVRAEHERRLQLMVRQQMASAMPVAPPNAAAILQPLKGERR